MLGGLVEYTFFWKRWLCWAWKCDKTFTNHLEFFFLKSRTITFTPIHPATGTFLSHKKKPTKVISSKISKAVQTLQYTTFYHHLWLFDDLKSQGNRLYLKEQFVQHGENILVSKFPWKLANTISSVKKQQCCHDVKDVTEVSVLTNYPCHLLQYHFVPQEASLNCVMHAICSRYVVQALSAFSAIDKVKIKSQHAKKWNTLTSIFLN